MAIGIGINTMWRRGGGVNWSSYWKTLNIGGTGSDETDYLLRLNVHRGTAPAVVGNRDVYKDDKCRTDLNDIIFTLEDGTPLDFYRHSVDNWEFNYDAITRPKYILPNGDIIGSHGTLNVLLVKSTDGGATYTTLYNSGGPAVSIIFVDSRGYIFILTNAYKILRSIDGGESFTEVWDMSDTNSVVIIHAMCEDNDGYLYFGEYQVANGVRINKSTDAGANWTQVYVDATRQHVHSMYCDPHTNAIYAGIDAASSSQILKSVDAGANWAAIRTGVGCDIVQMYSTATYRLFCHGETAGYAGFGIYKSTDDSAFTDVLPCSSPVKEIVAVDGKIYAFAPAYSHNRYPQIYVSEDDGDTWRTLKVLDYEGTILEGYNRTVCVPRIPKNHTDNVLYILENEIENGKVMLGGNHYQGLFYVKIPSLPAAGTIIKVGSSGGSVTASDVTVFSDAVKANLVGRWQIREGSGTTIADSSGNDNHGSIVGTPGSWNAFGIARYGNIWPHIKRASASYFFNQVNAARIVIPNNADFALDKSFTVVMWMSGDSTADGRYLLGFKNTTTGWGLRCNGVSDTLTLRYSTGAALTEIASSPGVYLHSLTTPKQPHMIGFKIDSTGAKVIFFIDGYINAQQNLANALVAPTADLWIGGADGDKAWKGSIEDVQIYGRELTDLEIRSLFEGRPMSATEAVIV